MDMKKAIVIGASSGIGRELAKVLSQNGYVVGLSARRTKLLFELQKEIPAKTFIKRIDVTQTKEAMNLLEELISEMDGMDLIVINSGVLFPNPNWEQEMETINVNVTGFAAMANIAMKYFCNRVSGHIVGISSIAALRGGLASPIYHASKAFVSNYLEGLRRKVSKLGVDAHITDIKPGYMDTRMTRGKIKSRKWLLMVAPSEKAARQVFEAIKNKRKHAYITKRWRIVAWLVKIMPNWMLNKL